MRFLALPTLLATLALGAQQPASRLQSFTLPNGLRVLLLEDHANPLLRASLRLTWSASDEPLEQEGLGAFLGALLERVGAGNQARPAFDKAVADAGVRLRFRHTANRFEWTAASGSADQEAALQALGHLVMRPSLDGPSVEGLRLNSSRALEAIPPTDTLRRRFLASLQGHVPLEQGALNRIGLEGLDAFHRRVVRPERAVLGLTGDLSLAQAKSLALLHLGTWGPDSLQPPLPGLPAPGLLTHPEGAPEAWLGALLPTPTARARAAVELLAAIEAEEPESPLLRGSEGRWYFLVKATAPRAEDLPEKVKSLQVRLENHLRERLTAPRFERAKLRWQQEEALLPLNPGRWLDRGLERGLGNIPEASEVQSVSLEDLRALLASSLAQSRLLITGVPKAKVADWVQNTPAFATWKSTAVQTEIPKRDAKSR